MIKRIILIIAIAIVVIVAGAGIYFYPVYKIFFKEETVKAIYRFLKTHLVKTR